MFYMPTFLLVFVDMRAYTSRNEPPPCFLGYLVLSSKRKIAARLLVDTAMHGRSFERVFVRAQDHYREVGQCPLNCLDVILDCR